MIKFDIDLLWTVINVLILCVAVRIFLFKPIHKILDERQKLVDDQLADAAKAKADAEALAEEHRNVMANIEEEKAKAANESAARAMEVYNGIVADANERAKVIISDAQDDAEAEKQRILHDAEKEVKEMVMVAVGKVVASGADADSSLYDQFLEKAGDADGEGND